MNINEIKQLLSTSMAPYEKARQQFLAAQSGPMSDIVAYLERQRGKELRPLLTLMSAHACGLPEGTKESNPVFRVAVLMELLHNATLMHDDVIDESALRRGEPTVNAQWGNQVAVLAGDYFLSQVMQGLHEIDNPLITDMVNHAVTAMSLGELIQLQQCGDYTIGETDYLCTIEHKTARLMQACCGAGAVLGTSRKDYRDAAMQFGMAYGMAFQMHDDWADMQPSSVTGKPQGNDLKEHKVTLPIILTLKRLEGDTKSAFLTLLQKEVLTDSDVQQAIQTIEASGAVEATQGKIAEQVQQALCQLARLPQSPYREGLTSMAESLT